MKTGSFSLILLLLATQLIGCAPRHKIFVSNTGQREAETNLTAAANSVSKSLAELAAIERATHPQAVLLSPMDPNMIGMAQLASIDWSGPVGPFVKKIAAASKYRLNVLGTPPGIPILISISAKDTPLADILRDATFQCGKKANIVIYPASKIIELRYVKS